MITSLFGTKLNMTQVFDAKGQRLVATRILVQPHQVSQVKTETTDGYQAVQIAFGHRRRLNKPAIGHLKKAGITDTTRTLREVKTSDGSEIPGTQIKIPDVLQIGDLVTVTGVSKGKGFAGVVKRHGFHGGPKTHGQSDRHRAPGSIGSGTTPGRVLKGKKMAGRMGNDQVTVKGLTVLDIDPANGIVFVSGPVPGARKGLMQITKVGENKKFAGIITATPNVTEEIKEEESGESTTEEAITEEASNSNTGESQEVPEADSSTESTDEIPADAETSSA